MTIKKLIYFILLLTFCISAQAQQTNDFHTDYNYLKDPITRGKLDFIFGYQRLNNNSFEFGIASGHRGYEGYAIVYSNYHLTTEHNFNADQYTLGTKVGYKLSILFCDFTGQAIYYTDFDKSNVAIRPEMGLTFLGLLDLNYGYNFMTINNDLNKFGGHLISLRVTIGKGSSGVL
jgi:hypothetical protein